MRRQLTSEIHALAVVVTITCAVADSVVVDVCFVYSSLFKFLQVSTSFLKFFQVVQFPVVPLNKVGLGIFSIEDF